jgi:hypothetical protein
MKPALYIASMLVVAGALTVSALPQDPDHILSVTRSFSLDGKWYSVGNPASVDSVMRKELGKRGNDISRIPSDILNADGFLVDVLSDIPAKTRMHPILLPSRFRAENRLQMESGDGFIEIASGKVYPKGDSFRKRFADSGWKIVEAKERGKPSCIATIRHEKEISIVLLEEREGSCLLIRHLEK